MSLRKIKPKRTRPRKYNRRHERRSSKYLGGRLILEKGHIVFNRWRDFPETARAVQLDRLTIEGLEEKLKKDRKVVKKGEIIGNRIIDVDGILIYIRKAKYDKERNVYEQLYYVVSD